MGEAEKVVEGLTDAKKKAILSMPLKSGLPKHGHSHSPGLLRSLREAPWHVLNPSPQIADYKKLGSYKIWFLTPFGLEVRRILEKISE